MENPHNTTDNVACPEIAQRYAPDDIPLRSGRLTLPNLHAVVDLPPDMRFIEKQDAKSYMRNRNHWSKCSIVPLVGLIVPPTNWQKRGHIDYPEIWMIEVYYYPGYVSNEDAISYDYNEIVQQVRESFYDREQAYPSSGGDSQYRHVMGWAIPPEFNGWNDSLMWSLHIAEGNMPDYSMPIHMAMLGRAGHFRLYMRGLLSRNQANSEIMRKASKSLSFQKGWTHSDRFVGKDPDQVTTIGAIVAESVRANLATPLTWGEYFRAVSYGLWKLIFHYAVELLAFVTIAILAIFVSWLRRSLSSRNPGSVDYDDDPDENLSDGPFKDMRYSFASQVDGPQRLKPVIRLNGVPLDKLR